ncbi:MAG TPA: EamA family transporter [Opitutaceae bacterium]|nr:EamA family transporter [Opitutaceae bacterium]
MPLLLLVSFLWAFSPGLIKGRLLGLDSGFIAAARLGLAFLVFLPLLRLRGVTMRVGLALAGIGAVQFGLMYLAYNESLRHLQSYEVALFTLTTPVFVTLFADALDRRLHVRALLAALVAVAAAAVVTVKGTAIVSTLTGVALVQFSNAAFAVGQVLYRRLRLRTPDLRDPDVFGLLFAGAFVVTLPLVLVQTDFSTFALGRERLLTLLYLGAFSTGLGFFLWNLAAPRVPAGLLAVMNNAKIPLMVACSLLFFHESADVPRLLLSGGLLVLAAWLAGDRGARPPPKRRWRAGHLEGWSKKMKLRKLMSLGGFALFFGSMLYVLLLKLMGDPRVQDHILGGSEMTKTERGLFFIGFAVSMFWWLRCLVVTGFRKEYRWLFAILVIWPLSVYYVWRED